MRVASAKDFGQIIKKVRTAQGLTQGQLAAACGTGVRFIVDIEKGKPTCELEKAMAVATMLGITLRASAPELESEAAS